MHIRAQQAFEGLSVAGPVGSDEYYGRSADERVADISVVSPSPACVMISVLAQTGNGTALADMVELFGEEKNMQLNSYHLA